MRFQIRQQRGSPVPPRPHHTQLSDARYQSLLAQASKLFSVAETDKDAQRLQVIEDILATMRAHSITVADLA
ncbi:MAG: hypothetical protein C0449_21370 [Polaromonas sp.]|nr:hypothetical protein [Polaromonas sp.]